MSKLANMPHKRPNPVVRTEQTPSTRTAEGAPGYLRDAKSELFLLAQTNMVSEDTFYETGKDRDNRFVRLVRQVAAEDPAWVVDMVWWLRNTANLRSASLVAAIEAGDQWKGTPRASEVLQAAMQRADEPSEVVGYWLATRGRRFPSWIKRALARAATRLYTVYTIPKYDSGPVRMADVLNLADVRRYPLDQTLADWIIARRKGRDFDAERIPMLARREALTARLRSLPNADARAIALTSRDIREAGLTWENVGSMLGGAWSARAWEKVAPTMGYMALLRNLRNFEQAGVDRATVDAVSARLADPQEVARSRQMPLRFLSAYKAVLSDDYRSALSRAADLSLGNIPTLPGRTAVLIDVSSSMNDVLSARSELKRWEAAALFGLAFALRNESAVWAYATGEPRPFPIRQGESLLRALDRFRWDAFTGGGTDTAGAVQHARRRSTADRLLLLTDEQTGQHWSHPYSTDQAVRTFDRAYTFNLAGYTAAQAASSDRHHTIGGLTDQGFTTMANIERGQDGVWPWES